MEFEKDGLKYTTDNEIVASAFLNSGFKRTDVDEEETAEAVGTEETAEPVEETEKATEFEEVDE